MQAEEQLNLWIKAVKEYAIYLVDPSGHITSWNNGAENITGYHADEVIGQSISIFFTDGQLPEKILRQTTSNGSYRDEGWHKKKDGSLFFADSSWAPLYDEKQQLSGFAAITKDITEYTESIQVKDAPDNINERKKTEQALKNSELRFRSLIEKGGEIIALHDEQGKIIYMSTSIHTLLGYHAEERIGKQMFEWVHPDDVARLKKILSELMKTPGGVSTAQWQHRHANGSWHWMAGVATNLLHDPSVNAVVHNFRDITETKKTEDELKEKNSELHKLSAYLQNVREEERKYIAREVHDELGQLASALKIDIDWLNLKSELLGNAGQKRIEHANRTIEVLMSSIRKIASRLRPSILDDFGLNAALQWHCTEFQTITGIVCVFESQMNDHDLSIELKTELFRITQESLTNVMRHSKAVNVEVIIKDDAQNIYLSIADDGEGFDASVHKNTLGLIGLRERAVSLNGALRIASEVGKGTIVIAVIPKK